ncbi:MAG: hypothetical protein JWM59_4979 [Verrucomicrobiales bacterium]|nr:hypothetical protein [Verrucomicrobiales bacterium]
MHLFIFPSGNPQVQRVHSFQELISTPFGDGVNALCWERTLPGDFNEVVERLGTGEGIVGLDEEILAGLDLSPAGRTAADVMLQDLQRLRDHGLAPELNCIHGYPRDEEDNAVPTHVYSFHADSATTEADTWLCTYHGASSEGVANEEARRRSDIAEIRAELLALHGGKDDGDFQDYLSENCHDLHYIPLPHARPFTFGLGNLWRIAVDYPGSPVPPCIHRAPETLPGDPPRLLLIS